LQIGVEVGAAGGAGADPEVADGEAGDLEGGENLHSMTLNRSNPVEMKMRRNTDLTIALAGNPNAGKTTVFNRLTGSRQHTGNWPGKTIERKSGWYKHASMWIEVVDLPGTYSLAAYSEEEIVARDFLLEGQADVVVVVVDASNLERNLYLVVQILELQIPVLIALNMTDMAETIGFEINSDDLSEGLGGAPVIRMVAARGKGIDELKEEILLYTKQQSIERTPDSIV
jgi:ferrous iron transport protein B